MSENMFIRYGPYIFELLPVQGSYGNSTRTIWYMNPGAQMLAFLQDTQQWNPWLLGCVCLQLHWRMPNRFSPVPPAIHTPSSV